jgi:hypothetical protein
LIRASLDFDLMIGLLNFAIANNSLSLLYIPTVVMNVLGSFCNPGTTLLTPDTDSV